MGDLVRPAQWQQTKTDGSTELRDLLRYRDCLALPHRDHLSATSFQFYVWLVNRAYEIGAGEIRVPRQGGEFLDMGRDRATMIYELDNVGAITFKTIPKSSDLMIRFTPADYRRFLPDGCRYPLSKVSQKSR